MSKIAKQTQAYRMARRIVRACNRMKAGRGVALQWCAQQRHVLHWMARKVRAGLDRREAQRIKMKERALWRAKADYILAFTRIVADGASMHPLVKASLLAACDAQHRNRIMHIAATPAREFRHDRPEIDPARQSRVVGVDLAKPGAERTVVTVRGGK